jgi:hypothetical protein
MKFSFCVCGYPTTTFVKCKVLIFTFVVMYEVKKKVGPNIKSKNVYTFEKDVFIVKYYSHTTQVEGHETEFMDKVSSNNIQLKVIKSCTDFLNWVSHPSADVLVSLENKKFEIMKIGSKN